MLNLRRVISISMLCTNTKGYYLVCRHVNIMNWLVAEAVNA